MVFELACACGALFEGWFADRADFERQADGGLLACPTCGSRQVRKVLSPVRSVRTADRQGAGARVAAGAAPEAAARHLLKNLQEYVLDNFEDVGTRLCEESLKVRYGLSAPRNIRGVATEAEEEMLAGEGIELLKLPMPAKPEEDA